MLSKTQRRQILQLSQKKHRLASGLFVAEGEKVVRELLDSNWTYHSLYSTDSKLHPEAEHISEGEMKQLSHFKTPSPVLGVFEMPQARALVNESVSLVLDGISDPGNLGTLIRLCDWFGLSELICSKSTVDCFNPKVVQATMGSIARVHCHYVCDLGTVLRDLNKPIFGASASGTSIYTTTLPPKGTYVLGSESHGISKAVSAHLDATLAIPHFKSNQQRAESLNVATAGAIFLSELFRSNGLFKSDNKCYSSRK